MSNHNTSEVLELISIVVPVYNVADYLDRCVESLLSQRYSNIEIILVDDGSCDGSGQKCDNWQDRDCRIRVIHQENQGLSAARNAGANDAGGNYIAFVDSDDCVDSQYINYLHDCIVKLNADLACCRFVHFSDCIPDACKELPQPTAVTGIEACKRIYTREGIQFVVGTCKLYKTSLVRQFPYAKGRLHEDEFTTYKIMLAAKCVAISTAPLYWYYVNPSSITHKITDKHYADILAAFKERDIYLNRPEWKDVYRLAHYYFVQWLIGAAKLRIPGAIDCLKLPSSGRGIDIKMSIKRFVLIYLGFSIDGLRCVVYQTIGKLFR